MKHSPTNSSEEPQQSKNKQSKNNNNKDSSLSEESSDGADMSTATTAPSTRSSSLVNLTDNNNNDTNTTKKKKGSPVRESTAQPRPKVKILPRGIGPIEKPNENDVLCGRGGRVNAHVGNVQFRCLVNERKREYLAPTTQKLEKAHVAAKLVEDIRNMVPPGRFLLEDAQDGMWYDIGDTKAIRKVGQAMRQNAPCLRKELYGEDVYETTNDDEEETWGGPPPHAQMNAAMMQQLMTASALQGNNMMLMQQNGIVVPPMLANTGGGTNTNNNKIHPNVVAAFAALQRQQFEQLDQLQQQHLELELQKQMALMNSSQQIAAATGQATAEPMSHVGDGGGGVVVASPTPAAIGGPHFFHDSNMEIPTRLHNAIPPQQQQSAVDRRHHQEHHHHHHHQDNNHNAAATTRAMMMNPQQQQQQQQYAVSSSYETPSMNQHGGGHHSQGLGFPDHHGPTMPSGFPTTNSHYAPPPPPSSNSRGLPQEPYRDDVAPPTKHENKKNQHPDSSSKPRGRRNRRDQVADIYGEEIVDHDRPVVADNNASRSSRRRSSLKEQREEDRHNIVRNEDVRKRRSLPTDYDRSLMTHHYGQRRSKSPSNHQHHDNRKRLSLQTEYTSEPSAPPQQIVFDLDNVRRFHEKEERRERGHHHRHSNKSPPYSRHEPQEPKQQQENGAHNHQYEPPRRHTRQEPAVPAAAEKPPQEHHHHQQQLKTPDDDDYVSAPAVRISEDAMPLQQLSDRAPLLYQQKRGSATSNMTYSLESLQDASLQSFDDESNKQDESMIHHKENHHSNMELWDSNSTNNMSSSTTNPTPIESMVTSGQKDNSNNNNGSVSGTSCSSSDLNKNIKDVFHHHQQQQPHSAARHRGSFTSISRRGSGCSRRGSGRRGSGMSQLSLCSAISDLSNELMQLDIAANNLITSSTVAEALTEFIDDDDNESDPLR